MVVGAILVPVKVFTLPRKNVLTLSFVVVSTTASPEAGVKFMVVSADVALFG